jgi:hypothetical protein
MRIRFSLRQLLGLVTFVAIACGGLVRPSPTSASAIFTLTLAVLLVAVLAAVGRKGSQRAFWIGFAIAGWGYLWLAHWPDDERYFTNRSWELQTNGPLLTTKLLRLAHNALHPPPDGGFGGGGFFSIPVEQTGGPARALGLPFAQFSPPRPMPVDYEANLNAFMRIGHSLWALLFAYLGGLLTRYFYDTRPALVKKEDSTP